MTLNIAFFMATILPFAVIAGSMTLKRSPYDTIIRALLFGVLGALLVIMIGSASGTSIGEQLDAVFNNAAKDIAGNKDLIEALQLGGKSEEEQISAISAIYSGWINILPAVIFVWAAIAAYLEYMLFSKLMRRQGRDIAPIPPVREFNLPRSAFMLWFIMYIVSYIIAQGDLPVGETVYLNIDALMKLVFAYQGISLIFALMYSKRLPGAFAVLAVIVLLLTNVGLFILFIIGLIDLAFAVKFRLTRHEK